MEINNKELPQIGQGTWYIGENPHTYQQEKEAIITGIQNGLNVIDTAEMYGEGLSEILIGDAIKSFDRQSLYLVSKVYPHNAGRNHIFISLEESLKRLNTNYLDLYLLHWRGSVPLKETVECMEELKSRGMIKAWGVSNFDTDDMEELWKVPNGNQCAINQVLYHVASRGIEYDLIPWHERHNIPIMAYCPIAHGGKLRKNLYQNKVLNQIAINHQATVPQIMLAFVIRKPNIIAIVKSGNIRHVLENAKALNVILTNEELDMIDQEFPAPKNKTYLDIV
ncbi:MAG: aldo/keto reductase [Erysipelotrichaceae bacterium]|nr:aldo/keto reductase [Erysipelotrichaceae bacterium]